MLVIAALLHHLATDEDMAIDFVQMVFVIMSDGEDAGVYVMTCE